MDIYIYAEKDFEADLNVIVKSLNRICKKLRFGVGKAPFSIPTEFISHPDTYFKLNKKLLNEVQNSFKTFLFTNKQYDNNYFFQTADSLAIISFFGWADLTILSKNNGVVHFIADLVALYIDNSFRHDETTGCIYDFAGNKKAIDLKMRNAFICPTCLSRITSKKLSTDERDLFLDVREMLDVLGKTSKWNQDIVEYWESLTKSNPKTIAKRLKKQLDADFHDVFLAHNSIDNSSVEKIYKKLKAKGIKPWYDKEQIPPGRWFQDVIQDAIKKISSVAIFISNNGLGRWQIIELRSFISQCVDRRIPIIPVLLPGVNVIPEEYIFLNEFTWVKFKKNVDEEGAIDNLIWGITGKHPRRNGNN